MKILFDIGGTKTRIAKALNGEGFSDPVIFETAHNYEEGIKKFIEAVREVSGGQKIETLCGGIAGPFGGKNRSLLTSPNLSGWVEKPFVVDLEKAFDANINIENDSAMVGLGESSFGAGKGFGIVAYITVSTGVGGVRIIDGKIDRKSIGFEPGHQIVDMDKTLISDADGITLGNYISGRGVEKRTGKKPFEITDNGFWDKMARVLAVGLNNTIVHWSPDVVVLGGSMMKEVGISVDKTDEYLKETLKIFPQTPPLKRAELGDLGGLYGALVYNQ